MVCLVISVVWVYLLMPCTDALFCLWIIATPYIISNWFEIHQPHNINYNKWFLMLNSQLTGRVSVGPMDPGRWPCPGGHTFIYWLTNDSFDLICNRVYQIQQMDLPFDCHDWNFFTSKYPSRCVLRELVACNYVLSSCLLFLIKLPRIASSWERKLDLDWFLLTALSVMGVFPQKARGSWGSVFYNKENCSFNQRGMNCLHRLSGKGHIQCRSGMFRKSD